MRISDLYYIYGTQIKLLIFIIDCHLMLVEADVYSLPLLNYKPLSANEYWLEMSEVLSSHISTKMENVE